MTSEEFQKIQREHADIWRRFRLVETQDEGMAIMGELFSLWPYNRTEKNTEANS